MSSDVVISVRDVSKVYHMYERPQDRLKQLLWRGKRNFHDEFWALRNINFDVKKGETVGIIGRNGSGKSTLLQAICGTLAPSSGKIIRIGRISALLELGSGFNPEFSGRENVYLNGAILGLSRNEIDARFDEIEKFADIGLFIDSPVKHYSSGMFARLAFSVAIHVDPDILIVDEILAVGDAAFQRRCLKKFYEIRDNGCTILFVSHDIYQIKTVCQKALYLKNGCQVAFGNADMIANQYAIDTESASENIDIAKHKIEKPAFPIDPQKYIFNIHDVKFVRMNGKKFEGFVYTNESVVVEFSYTVTDAFFNDYVTFVFNLKRHDDFYVCGSTTLMDGYQNIKPGVKGTIKLIFSNLNIMSGEYKLRLAVNDVAGLGILGEQCSAVCFRVLDDFQSDGLVNLNRKWILENTNVD